MASRRKYCLLTSIKVSCPAAVVLQLSGACLLLLILLGLGDVADAKYHHTCPHQLPVGPWHGVCGERLIRRVKDMCKLYKPAKPGRDLGRRQQDHKAASLAILLGEKKTTPERPAIRRRRRQADDANNNGASLLHLPMINHEAIMDAILSPSVARTFLRTGVAGLKKAGQTKKSSGQSNWTDQNIVCECCYNSCSIQEMLEYCPQ